MSHIVEALLDNAERDLDLLSKNLEHGDRVEAFRDLDFVFISEDKKQAKVLAEFVVDNHYGTAKVEREPGTKRWRVLVAVHAPATAQVVCCISGLMTCLAKLFKLEYDGWGSLLQLDEDPDADAD